MITCCSLSWWKAKLQSHKPKGIPKKHPHIIYIYGNGKNKSYIVVWKGPISFRPYQKTSNERIWGGKKIPFKKFYCPPLRRRDNAPKTGRRKMRALPWLSLGSKHHSPPKKATSLRPKMRTEEAIVWSRGTAGPEARFPHATQTLPSN